MKVSVGERGLAVRAQSCGSGQRISVPCPLRQAAPHSAPAITLYYLVTAWGRGTLCVRLMRSQSWALGEGSPHQHWEPVDLEGGAGSPRELPSGCLGASGAVIREQPGGD